MGRPRYQIIAEDQDAASGWIGRHLVELPNEAAWALRKASSPADLQGIVDLFFSPSQRRRLHNAICQARHRARQESLSVTLDRLTADRLYHLARWWPGKSINDIIKRLVLSEFNEQYWARIRALERIEGIKLPYDEAIKIKPGTLD